MFSSLLAVLFLGAFVYILPGRLLLAVVREQWRVEERFVYSLGLGLILVNVPVVLFVGLSGLYGLAFVETGHVVGFSAFLSLVFLGWGVGRRGWRPSPSRLVSSVRAAASSWRTLPWAFVGLTMMGATVYGLNFDRNQIGEEICDIRAGAALNGHYWQPELLRKASPDGELSERHYGFLRGQRLEANVFLTFNQTQRLGPAMVLGPFVSLFGTLGYRLAYALQGLLLPGLGLALGAALFRQRWAAWGTAVLLTFNPFGLEIQYFDSNFLALVFGSLALALLLRRQPAALLSAIALSLALGIKQEQVLALPAILFFVWRVAPRGGRRTLGFLGVLIAFCAPYLVMKGFEWWQEGLLYEPFSEFPEAHGHSFLGIPFEIHYLLGFPFVEEPLRSPYSAYPNFLSQPLDLLRGFGLILFALVPGGVIQLWRKARPSASLLLWWFVPLFLVVCAVSNWVEPNKMAIPLTALTSIVLFLVAGAVFLVERGPSLALRIGVFVVGFAVPLAFSLAVADVEVPLDERVLDGDLWDLEEFSAHVPILAEDSAAFVAWDRARLRPGLLPDYRPDRWRATMIGVRARQLAYELTHSSFREHERPIPDYFTQLYGGLEYGINALSSLRVLEGGGLHPTIGRPGAEAPSDTDVAVILDLSAPPALAAGGIVKGEAGEGSPDPLAVGGARVYVISGFEVPWSTERENVVVGEDRFGSVQIAVVPSDPTPVTRETPYEIVKLDAADFPGLRVPLRIHPGHVHIHQPRGYQIKRSYVGDFVVDEDGVKAVRPYAVFL